MKKPDLKPLKPNQRVRVLVDGIGCFCRVTDIASAAIMDVVDAINAERAAGKSCIGFARRVERNGREWNVQIDLVN